MFAGIGVPYDSAEFFRAQPRAKRRARAHGAVPQSRADSSTQRLLTPRFALTAAEYLAFVEGKHVLVILTDMTNYAEALREVSSSEGRDPKPQGIPGLYVFRSRHAVRARGLHSRHDRDADPTLDPDDARRRHRPSDSRPHRLHHRRPDRALARPRPSRHLSAGQRAPEPVAADEGRHGRELHASRPSGACEPSSTPPTRARCRHACSRASSARKA